MTRIGTVSDIDEAKRHVRVYFPDVDIVSGWIPVVTTGTPWMPDIDDVVICLYSAGFNGDGYVLGVLPA